MNLLKCSGTGGFAEFRTGVMRQPDCRRVNFSDASPAEKRDPRYPYSPVVVVWNEVASSLEFDFFAKESDTHTTGWAAGRRATTCSGRLHVGFQARLCCSVRNLLYCQSASRRVQAPDAPVCLDIPSPRVWASSHGADSWSAIQQIKNLPCVRASLARS
jgi:hypothetical protein